MELTMKMHPLAGIYAAAITPFKADQSVDHESIPEYLAFLAQRGCHGALLLGTTGEGPSCNNAERRKIFKAATGVWEEHPDFRLFAGTGTPSLSETTDITKFAFDLGFSAAVVLPPYYYHQAIESGIYDWYQELLRTAVPEDGYLIGYHFPAQAGVPIPLGVLTQLRSSYATQFIGIKDSTTEAEYTQLISQELDKHFVSFVGNDCLLASGLRWGASGCITAMANLHSPQLRAIWEAHQNGQSAPQAEEFIAAQRAVLNRYAPFAPSVKALMAGIHGFPNWTVKLPLGPLSSEKTEQVQQEMLTIMRESES
jgi:4-hydroxy-tetrahydrodipicolinate synthase